MPDLLTHYLVARIVTVKTAARPISPFFIGTVLPDILNRVPSIIVTNLFERYDCHLGWFLAIFHSPLVLMLVCFLLSLFFEQVFRKEVFKLLLFGAALHLGLDMLQKRFVSGFGYLWLFPFNFKTFSIPLFWPDHTIYFIPPLVLAVIISFHLRGRSLP